MPTKRRFGYLVWAFALGVFFVPECLAASSKIDRHLSFTTLSGVVGHLEYLSSSVEIPVTLVIVFTLVSLWRVPPRTRSGNHVAVSVTPHRTAAGRLTFQSGPAAQKTAQDFDDEPASGWFLLGAILTFALIAFGVIAARAWWPDAPPKPGETNALFHPGYVLYGSIALFWFVLPGLFAAFPGQDAPFPTLSRTAFNLEDWLRTRKWGGSTGPLFAWLLGHVVVWGLVFLLIHLTLYPYPNITHILNPSGQ